MKLTATSNYVEVSDVSPRLRNDFTETVRAASAVSLMAGSWLFVSPWVYGANTSLDAWNSWIVGAIIAILATVRLRYPTMNTWMSWMNCLLGMWIFASPFFYGYADDTGRFVNSLCVGGIVSLVAMLSATATPEKPMSVRQTHAQDGRPAMSAAARHRAA